MYASIELRSPINEDFPLCSFELGRLLYLEDITISQPARFNYNNNTQTGFYFIYEMHHPTIDKIQRFLNAIENSSNQIFQTAVCLKVSFPA